jgi:hypothetical protein
MDAACELAGGCQQPDHLRSYTRSRPRWLLSARRRAGANAAFVRDSATGRGSRLPRPVRDYDAGFWSCGGCASWILAMAEDGRLPTGAAAADRALPRAILLESDCCTRSARRRFATKAARSSTLRPGAGGGFGFRRAQSPFVATRPRRSAAASALPRRRRGASACPFGRDPSPSSSSSRAKRLLPRRRGDLDRYTLLDTYDVPRAIRPCAWRAGKHARDTSWTVCA